MEDNGQNNYYKTKSLKAFEDRFREVVQPLLEERLGDDEFTGEIIVNIRINKGFLRSINYTCNQLERFGFEEQFREGLTRKRK
jgi:hypothetical protein